jgi:DNA-binding GntR family transcriptional regulator
MSGTQSVRKLAARAASPLPAPAASPVPAPAASPVPAIVETLQEDIVIGRLAPRERLVEEELAERFRTKRHVVREALGELERIGMIERRPNRGAVVRQLTPHDVAQIYSVREVLERAAASQIPLPLDRPVLAGLEAIQKRHDAAVARGDGREVFRVNFEFHDALYGACGNPYLAAAIGDFRKKTHVVWSYAIVKPEYFRGAQREHRAMLRALREGDRARLVDLCVHHLDISRDAYLQTWKTRFPNAD